MTFALVLAKKPISAQKRGKKQRYKQEIHDAALKTIGKAKLPLFSGQLYVRITWFHAVKPNIDIDNIVKPILDALGGIVYEDDRQIAQCLITKVDSREEPILSKDGISSELYKELKNLLNAHEHLLYIEVDRVSLKKIFFGPIDGEKT